MSVKVVVERRTLYCALQGALFLTARRGDEAARGRLAVSGFVIGLGELQQQQLPSRNAFDGIKDSSK